MATAAPPGPRVPRGLRLVLGIVCVLLGAVLVLRPFSSLAVLLVLVVVGLAVAGIAGLVVGDHARTTVLRGIVLIVAAIAVGVWPGATLAVLTVVLAVALVVGGAIDLAHAPGVRGTARANAVLGGLTSIVFGVLALAWPDVTVLVIAVVFGAWLVILGVTELVGFARGRAVAVPLPGPRGAPRAGWWRLTGGVLGALVALVLVVVSLVLQRGVPTPDAFYHPPDDLPSAPGQLLRSEPFDSDEIPADATAWKILYTTTRDEGQPAIASGLVVAPTSAAAPSPVVAWAHGTTGAAIGCAPSILDDGLSAGAMFLQDQVVGQGWALVATDYTGLGTPGPHPYLIGQGEGRSVLDAVRAAHQLTDAHLADETVVWGHSQGGHAALWAGMLAPTYAPELDLVGVAALAPASNLPGLVDSLGNVTGGELFASYVVDAYTATYPDVRYDDLVRPGARIIVREMAQRCLAEPGILVSVLTALSLDKPIWAGDPSSGAFLTRLTQNVPSGPIAAPLFIGQGADDSLVVPAAQDAYVAARCAAGYAVDYRTYPGRDHVPLVEPDSPLVPELLAWTADRFAGVPAADTC
jgi:uncharacterized membrane protein HdeD (DUF308 family)/pimeloyl-ACP methyl ester carboxylesterase